MAKAQLKHKATPAKPAPAPAKSKTAATKTVTKKPVPVPEPEPEVEAPQPRTRGPRGTTEDAVITILVEANPKREGSRAHAMFSHYVEGMTVGEYADSLAKADMGKEATPGLVYDTKHGYIAIEGYEVPGGVTPNEPKEPKAAKAPSKGSVKKGKGAASAAVEEEAEEEQMA